MYFFYPSPLNILKAVSKQILLILALNYFNDRLLEIKIHINK